MDLEVPRDLAELIEQLGHGVDASSQRSTTVSMVTEGLPAIMTVITLAQGPLTVAQLRELFQRWRAARSSRREEIGRIKITGRRGETIDVGIFPDTDLEKVAKLAHEVLFGAPEPPHGTGGAEL